MSEHDFDVVVIGGGQAGLAMGYYLREQGLRFAIVERGDSIAPALRERWDSLTLFTPRRYSALPGLHGRRLQSSADRLRNSSPRHNALIRRSDRMVRCPATTW
jgi:cation diffusion facilitator CzcD-associated flavoprotein CzcO